MSTEQSDAGRTAPRRRPSRVLRVILRAFMLMLVILVSVGLGALAYYGVPALYRHYVQPVRESVARLDDLEARQEDTSQRTTRRLDDLNTRLEMLEVQGDVDKETTAQLQADLESIGMLQVTQQASFDSLQAQDRESLAAVATLQAGLNPLRPAQETQEARVDSLAAQSESAGEAVATLHAGLNTMESVQATLEVGLSTHLGDSRAELEAAQSELATLQSSVESISQTMTQNRQAIQALQEAWQSNEAPLNAQQRELQLLQALELTTRVRLLLARDDVSQTRQDLQAAHDLLVALQGRVTADQVESIGSIITHLNAALGNLTDSPGQAADDVALAWELLIRSLARETATVTPTATLPPTPTPTPAGTRLMPTLTPTDPPAQPPPPTPAP